jgi:beta-phosphoglucomutase
MSYKINLLISDFDGTLVDTFQANFAAYQEAFQQCGYKLSIEQYRACFGFRFDKFMDYMHIYDNDTRKKIKEIKGEVYPQYFHHLKINTSLLAFIKSFKINGGKTAVASTARRKNLMNALDYIEASNYFDLVLSGEDVSKGKPNPEIYLKVLEYFQMEPEEALVFEDSEVGITAAENAGISYIEINKKFYGNRG